MNDTGGIAILFFNTVLLSSESHLLTVTIEVEDSRQQAEAKMCLHEGLDLGVGVEELDNDSFPALWRGHVEEEEEEDLENEGEEEDGVGEFEHKYL